MSTSLLYLRPPLYLLLPCIILSLIPTTSACNKAEPVPEVIDAGHQLNGGCLANKLMLIVERKIQELLKVEYTKTNLKNVKDGLKIIMERNKKKIKKIMLLKTCIKKSVKNLEKLELLMNATTRESWIKMMIHERPHGLGRPH